MIRLTKVEQRHFEEVCNLLQEGEFKEYMRRYPPIFTWLTRESFLQMLAYSYLILDEDKVVGIVNLGNLDQTSRKMEFGIGIKKDCGKEKRSIVATEALRQLFDYAFNAMGLNKVYAICLSHRKDIEALLLRWNFQAEGLLRDNIYCDGKYNDEVVYGFTRADYDAIPQELK